VVGGMFGGIVDDEMDVMMAWGLWQLARGGD